jgi:hypothetical protein
MRKARLAGTSDSSPRTRRPLRRRRRSSWTWRSTSCAGTRREGVRLSHIVSHCASLTVSRTASPHRLSHRLPLCFPHRVSHRLPSPSLTSSPTVLPSPCLSPSLAVPRTGAPEAAAAAVRTFGPAALPAVPPPPRGILASFMGGVSRPPPPSTRLHTCTQGDPGVVHGRGESPPPSFNPTPHVHRRATAPLIHAHAPQRLQEVLLVEILSEGSSLFLGNGYITKVALVPTTLAPTPRVSDQRLWQGEGSSKFGIS